MDRVQDLLLDILLSVSEDGLMSPPSKGSWDPSQVCLATNTTGDHFPRTGSPGENLPNIMERIVVSTPPQLNLPL